MNAASTTVQDAALHGAAHGSAARPPRPVLWVTCLLFGLLSVAGLIALGLWQLERLEWKTALIARVEHNLSVAPEVPPGPSEWATLKPEQFEYRRVTLRGQFAHDKETLVAATTGLGSGYWVVTPLLTEQGQWVLVNRGFITPAQRGRAARDEQDVDGVQTVTGLLRVSEPGGGLLRANDPPAGRWYSRDVAAIATASGLRSANGSGSAAPVAPYFVDSAAVDDAPLGWPRPGLTVLHFSNNHLGYAITWFLLAAFLGLGLGCAIVTELRAHGRPRDGD